jgi:hypothetical protein
MEFEFDAERRLFRVTLVGQVDSRHCVELIAAMLAHPDFKPGTPAIWNAQNADLSGISYEDISQMRAFQEGHAGVRGQARIALVAGNDMSFGVGRMAAQINDLPHLEINVFRDLPAAEHWALRKT